MVRTCWYIALVLLLLKTISATVQAEELNLENSPAPTVNKPDETIAKEYSLDKATHFLDVASLDWTKSRKCFTCHTNYSYLMARPEIGKAQAHQDVRTALETLVEKTWPGNGPRWDAEVVMAAATLAINDAKTTGKLHPTTQKALDRMWTVQKEDGGFRWLTCGWPPFESDDHYGVTIALIGLGMAPGDYTQTEAAQKGIAGLKRYLADNPSPTLHHEAMVLWASKYVDGLLSKEEQQKTVDKILAKQKKNGGWALASLGDWKRADEKEQDTETSDGYATGFLVFVLRQSGVAREHASLTNGISWLKSNQRESGRWHTRSLNRDNHHFISHAGTAFAIMALKACDAL
jgi:squalene-hopene/tetraprenyl-beta-curcumene cyclase